jgi:NAD(P)-dependent dehydrogenase (short-subunit alcohol dehydrogenase family)/uncharacterized OB-fold protein
LTPSGSRSRSAHILTAAAAEGDFGLPTCALCGHQHYPPRDACPKCLSCEIALGPADNRGILLAATTVEVATDPYFRERSPWRVGTVALAAGPIVVAHVHGSCVIGAPLCLSWRLDRGGNAVAFAEPAEPSPHIGDDLELREMTNDPKFRRVLITDGRSSTAHAMAKALADAGAAIVFVGVADRWKPFSDHEKLANIPQVQIVPLDLTDSTSVHELAGDIGARVDILVNTSEHIRPGGLIERPGVTLAREEMEAGYLGLMRLAQGFGPVMRFRGADGVASACAWVNLLSVHALMPWSPYAAYSASQAAMLSAALSLRAELRSTGVRVVNVFSGPLDTDWFQTVPPPKVAPTQLAKATVHALKRGIEDVFVGDVAEDVRARLAKNPKALERELGT